MVSGVLAPLDSSDVSHEKVSLEKRGADSSGVTLTMKYTFGGITT